MSGGDERVVFVLAEPGDESLVTGGSIARLRSAGADVRVLYRSVGTAVPGEIDAAFAALGGGDGNGREWHGIDWRSLPAASADPVADLSSVLSEHRASAVVIGTGDEVLQGAAIDAAADHGIPAYVSTRVTGAAGARVSAIDVSAQVEQKLLALAAYRSRWTVKGTALVRDDGSLLAVTGTESYLRVDPPASSTIDVAPTVTGRVTAAVAGMLAGIAFGLLGTIAHQSTIAVGAVTIPVGLILAVTGASALLIALRMLLADRLVVLAAAVGLLGTIFLLSLQSSGGSVLIPQGVPGTVWTIVPALVAAVAVAWPRLHAHRLQAHGGQLQ